MLQFVPPALLPVVWPQCLPLIERALRKNPHEDWTPNVLRSAIESGNAWLFIVAGRGLMVTEIRQPHHRPRPTFHIWLLVGPFKGIHNEIFDAIDLLATKSCNAERITFGSRRNWLRAAAGRYQVARIEYERKLP